MNKRVVLKVILPSVGAVILAFAMVYGVWFRHVSGLMAQFNKPQPPTTVSSARVREQQWTPMLSAVGTLRAENGVDVTAEVGGKIIRLNFDSGKNVNNGDLLVQLDDSTDVADLAGLRAQLKLDEQNLKRSQSLYEKKLASKEQLDNAETQVERSRAAVASKQSLIAKKAIRAPFSGQLGIRQVDLGQYVSPGTPVVTLQNLDRLLVNFTLPEQYAQQVKPGQKVELEVDSWPGRTFDGMVNAVSPKVDPATHNVSVQASLDNSKHELKPGMFADVKVYVGEPHTVMTVPNTAVNYTLYGDSVFVIQQADQASGNSAGKPADGQSASALKVVQRFVKVGEQRHGEVAVTQGLKPGDTVVSAGGFKLRDGASVQINNEVKLDQATEANR
ncbi:MAG: efflux RND transporter periplasmic adaptor subunit [Gammaproteobacteria bacterium]|jgi:membrane fusion protein (multidrug efflux system)